MRFKSEFEIVSHIDERVIENFKANGQFELGRRVADLRSWSSCSIRPPLLYKLSLKQAAR